jgi:hypothetical protein
MNAKDFQDILKESKDILQEGGSGTEGSRSRYLDREYLGTGEQAATDNPEAELDRIAQKHDDEFYTRYDKKSLMEIIRKKLEEAGEIIDDPSIIMDKLARFIDDIKAQKSSALKDYQDQERP